MAQEAYRSSDPDLLLVGPALALASKSAADEARRTGTMLAVWRDSKVVLLTPDEFEGKVSVVREDSKASYGESAG